MEKHICKFCFKQFSNGKALGGHMKSHLSILQTPPPLPPAKAQFTEIDSASVSTGDEDGEEEEEEEEEVRNVGGGGLNYRLRENPKKSYRLVDPVFSSPMDAGSVVLDRESDTDESFKNPTRRRSKRNRKHSVGTNQILKKPKILNHESSPVESEPVSSVSDTTPDEDVARCLMMLSRDVWMKQVEEEKSVDESEEEEEIRLCMSRASKKKKYQCESCKKYFRSYQALGGHRANHKKVRSCIISCSSSIEKSELQNGTTNAVAVEETDQKFHECPICFKVFKNRQALGGHKRSHQSGSTTAFTPTTSTPNSFKFRTNLIDLNFPATIEEEEDNINEICIF